MSASPQSVGNSISGGRSGYKGQDSQWGDPKSEADVHVSGNALNLFPAFPVSAKGYDGLGGAVVAGMVRRGMVSGNIMTAGEVGAWWSDGTASSILLKNDFASASYQGLLYEGTNGPQHRFLIVRNAFNQGYRYHLRPTWEDGRAYFFGENVFKSGTNIVSPFITPYGAPVHFRY